LLLPDGRRHVRCMTERSHVSLRASSATRPITSRSSGGDRVCARHCAAMRPHLIRSSRRH
jgi:hypothetical protein